VPIRRPLRFRAAVNIFRAPKAQAKAAGEQPGGREVFFPGSGESLFLRVGTALAATAAAGVVARLLLVVLGAKGLPQNLVDP
jgi:hypothetical protein